MIKGANNAFHPICSVPIIIKNIWFVLLPKTNTRTMKGHMSPCLNCATRKINDHKGGQAISFVSCFGTPTINKQKELIHLKSYQV